MRGKRKRAERALEEALRRPAMQEVDEVARRLADELSSPHATVDEVRAALRKLGVDADVELHGGEVVVRLRRRVDTILGTARVR